MEALFQKRMKDISEDKVVVFDDDWICVTKQCQAWNRFHCFQCKKCGAFKHLSVNVTTLEKIIVSRYLGCLKIGDCIKKEDWKGAKETADIFHLQYRAYVMIEPPLQGFVKARYFETLASAKQFVAALFRFCPRGIHTKIGVYAIMPPEFETRFICSFLRPDICLRHYVSLCLKAKDSATRIVVNENAESMKRFVSCNDAINLYTNKCRGDPDQPKPAECDLWYAVVTKPSKDFVIYS